NGKSDEGKQHYYCRHTECSRRSFIRDYSYRGYLPEVKQQINDVGMNGSRIQDTARVLKISPTTLIGELKKDRELEQVNAQLLEQMQTQPEAVMVVRVEKAAMDQMWSFVKSKRFCCKNFRKR
ncbi:MAG TPA: IS1-like element transposase, partial [Candidatus Caenarcaniphilales bacterium]